ncbi:MAG TPA: hypothetical protein VIC31_06605, partial [Rudaea sp.]
PIDPAAYDEYLKGRALHRQRKDLVGVIAHFKAAVAIEPKFAAAWSSLSLACEVSFWYRHMTPAEQAAMLACEADAADHAAALDPNAAATEHALGNVVRSRFQYADAERHYLRAMQIDPSYPDVREDYSEVLYEVGRMQDSARAARELVTLDPYFVVGWNRVRSAAVALDARADVEEATRQMLALAPGSIFGKLQLLDYALAHGRVDEARAAYAQTRARWPNDPAIAFTQILLPWALGDQNVDADKLNAAIVEAPPGEASFYLIARHDMTGYNAYVESLGAILQAYYFANLASSKPAGLAMLRDPQVKAQLIRYGFPAYWREKGWPSICRPLGEHDFECGVEAAPAHG